MDQPLYTSGKVNNEIELCEIADPECKELVEKALLSERISYYIRWPKSSFFHRNRHACIICVNENAVDTAGAIVRYICDEWGFSVKFLLRKSHNHYL